MLNPSEDEDVVASQLSMFLESTGSVRTLNVAGHRESRCPGLQGTVFRVVTKILMARQNRTS